MSDKTGSTEFLSVAIAGLSGHYDIGIDVGRIASLTPSQATGGGFATPLLADVHVHLDKTFTIERIAQRDAPRSNVSLMLLT